MVQSYRSPVALDVVPMQLPDMNLAYGTELSAATDDLAATQPEDASLVLYPGEPTELMLRLRNESERPLRFVVHFNSIFPDDWQLTPLEDYELLPAARQQVTLVFQAPTDFFETLTDVTPGERRPLNYSGRLDIYSYTLAGDLEDVISEPITLMVRPHSSYAKLLPQVYQEIDLVSRLMAVVERTFRPDVDTWNALWAYLNPLIAPQAMLGFLAHWVGWKRLPQLTWEQQRRLIHRALELYSWRGTAHGLRLFLHLATGLPLDADNTPESQKHISILEPSLQGAVFGESSLLETTVFGGAQRFHFIVVLRPPADITLDQNLVRAIIDQERPAFCTYELYIHPLP
ncbi:MAG: phage tail protein [Cyanobacteria bacterium P01_D01_bin.156]